MFARLMERERRLQLLWLATLRHFRSARLPVIFTGLISFYSVEFAGAKSTQCSLEVR
jgi:hypothetical protein